MAEKSIAVAADVKFAELSGKVTLGPVSAPALGVPVGTVVDLGVLATTEASTLWDRIKGVFARETAEQQLARRYQQFAASQVAV